MKSKLRISCFVFTAVALTGVARSQARDVREALDALLSTEYCATATMNGMDLSTALRGQSPVSGGGYFDVDESDWVPVLLEMAGEELEECIRDTANDIDEIRRLKSLGEVQDNSEEDMCLRAAYKRVRARRQKLMKIPGCLQGVEGKTEEILATLERVGLESPPEFDMALWVNVAMVDKACRDGCFERCLNLGRRYRALFGPGSRAEWTLVQRFADYGIPKLSDKSDRDAGMRYFLEFGDTLWDSSQGKWFDDFGQASIQGWIGSLQRRQLAERCLAFDEARGTGETSTERVQRVCPWAAAELATEDSSLTDLREVYGNWTTDGEEK